MTRSLIDTTVIDQLEHAYLTRSENLRFLMDQVLQDLKMWAVSFRYRNKNLFQLVGYACRGLPGSTYRGSHMEHFRTYRDMVASVIKHARRLLSVQHPWVVRDGRFVKEFSLRDGNLILTKSVNEACWLHPDHADFLVGWTRTTLYPFLCADCGGPLEGRFVKKWRTFAFLCKSYPHCRGLCSAHPDESPVGFPVDQATRRARRLTHAVFDPIWQAAPNEYEGGNPGKFQRIGRYRCYAYIAHQMEIPTEHCHIGQMTIPELRVFYRHCIGLTYTKVRQWYKAK